MWGCQFTDSRYPFTMVAMKDTVLTADEVAALKGVTRSAVYAAIADGRLPHVRILGRLAIREGDARSWNPIRSPGRPKGIPMSLDAKKRISVTQKQRWKGRKRARGASKAS